MENEAETFIAAKEAQELQIRESVLDIDDILHDIKIVSIKNDIMQDFVNISKCRTDLQRALQFDKAKEKLKRIGKSLISEEQHAELIISSSKIL